ncbi:putative odorant-binding protein A10 [Macrosteles quadrilineatus]|uniref:putative odorant-binding protein A10 n=1 Tax=Macrosteles quadrilineatus TaxID=74068 RepID=UPI0023E24001|nr:putative odorant-binding protein A10 [Macrosteles quadrilineatus]
MSWSVVILYISLSGLHGLGTSPPEDGLQDISKDVKRIQDNEGLFDQYYQCLVGGPCTQDTKRLKDVIQEALQNDCARCTASQRRSAVDMLKLAMECRPVQFHELEKKFDPRGRFMSKYKRRGQGVGWQGGETPPVARQLPTAHNRCLVI